MWAVWYHYVGKILPFSYHCESTMEVHYGTV